MKRKTKILAIDDDLDYLDLLKRKLETCGYEAYTSFTPMDFEKSLKDIKPDLVLMDVLMPERSGFNILENFKDKGEAVGVPVIFLSGFDDDVEKSVAKSMGVRDYLIKPIDEKTLTDTIERSLTPSIGDPNGPLNNMFRG